MSETIVPFDGHEITVRYWPGDVVWRDRVSEQITGNLPTLIELTGTDWPDRPLVVQQSAQTLGTSYGGWYTSSDNRITIGRSINPELVLHELSHVWFQYDRLVDRWLIEGLADEFAALAADGPSGDSLPEVSLDDELAFALNSWVDPPSVDDTTTDRLEAERWAYQASSHVTRTTRELIGVDAFTYVTRSILGGVPSYPVHEGEPADGPDRRRTWREFLDLASDHTADEQELAELYATWVEGGWTDRFEQRSVARQRYGALQDRVDGVVLPAAVRLPMRDWDFAGAGDAIDATQQLLDDVEVLRTRLGDRGVTLPADFADRFAGSASVEELATYQADILAVGDDVIGFVERIDSLDRWQRIGLIGADLDLSRPAALDAFEAGDFSEATGQIERGGTLLDGARQRGVVRLVVACSISLITLALLIGFRRRRQRPRRRRHGRDGRQPTDAPLAPDIDLTAEAVGYISSSSEITTSQRS